MMIDYHVKLDITFNHQLLLQLLEDQHVQITIWKTCLTALSAFPPVKHARALIRLTEHLEWTLMQQVVIQVNAPAY